MVFVAVLLSILFATDIIEKLIFDSITPIFLYFLDGILDLKINWIFFYNNKKV